VSSYEEMVRIGKIQTMNQRRGHAAEEPNASTYQISYRLEIIRNDQRQLLESFKQKLK
jgi:hypothetical protein